MPTYEYQCKACEHHFTTEQRITENPLQTCPSCKKKKLERLISSSNFLLKGGGWYKDGYSSGASTGGSSGGTSAAAPSPAPSVAKGEACGKGEASPACASCPANNPRS